MGNFSKAFCGLEETPYGYVGWGGDAVVTSTPKDGEWDDADMDAYDRSFPEWDDHAALDGMVRRGELALALLERDRRDEWIGRFNALGREFLESGRVTKACNAFVALVNGTKPFNRYADELRAMRDDRDACAIKRPTLSMEWVEDFFDDYYGD